MPRGTTTPARRRKATPAVETPAWASKLTATVSSAILGKFDLSEIDGGAVALRGAVDGEQQAWLKTAKLLAHWRDLFLARDLSMADHFEPWAEAVTGRGVGSIRTYLTGRRVALELGISTMSKEVLQAVSMYDTETARAILAESEGDIGKTREIKARLRAEKEAGDPEAAAKAQLAKANRVKRFAKALAEPVRSAVGSLILKGEPVDTATVGEVYQQGFADGAMRMASKTGLVRGEEMAAAVTSLIAELHAERAAQGEVEAGIETV